MTRAPAVLGSTDPWDSGEVLPTAECVLAPNASPMTLDGTNTWILGAPGDAAVIVDPVRRTRDIWRRSRQPFADATSPLQRFC